MRSPALATASRGADRRSEAGSPRRSYPFRWFHQRFVAFRSVSSRAGNATIRRFQARSAGLRDTEWCDIVRYPAIGCDSGTLRAGGGESGRGAPGTPEHAVEPRGRRPRTTTRTRTSRVVNPTARGPRRQKKTDGDDPDEDQSLAKPTAEWRRGKTRLSERSHDSS